MKKLFTVLFVSALTICGNAQVKTPQASVSAEEEVTVGLTKVEIEYSRPSKKGRVIFGDLVPFGQIWRTGANKNTTISFSDDVEIGGKTVKAGTYAIFTKPEKDSWEIYFYADHENWGNFFKWDDTKVAAKTTAKVHHLSDANINTFQIGIGDVTNSTAKLYFLWDNTYVETEFTVPTDKKVMASIEQTMKAKPTAGDYMAAANYYYTTDKDIQQARKWMDEGMKLNTKPAYYQYYQQALITHKAGDKKAAMALAKKTLDTAKAAKSDEYVRNAEKIIGEWTK